MYIFEFTIILLKVLFLFINQNILMLNCLIILFIHYQSHFIIQLLNHVFY